MNIKRIYNSLEQCLKQIETKPFNEKLQSYDRASITGDYTFTETKNLEEAISLARYGWPKGRDIIKELSIKHESIFHKIFPQQDFELKINSSEEGEVVNMDNYLSGQPDDMLSYGQDEERIKKLANAKMQRIIISGEISCNVAADTIFNRGCIISSMINIMEIYGFRTELWLCHVRKGGSFYRNKGIEHWIKYFYKLKNFDEDLNLNNLAFAACHPSMIRRLNFALLEQEEDNNDLIPYFIHNAYGRCCDLSSDEISYEFGSKEFNNYGNIYFEWIGHNKTFKQLLEETEIKIKEHFTSIKI